MSLSMLARSAVRQRALYPTRAFHASTAARSAGHGHYHHLPFAWPGEKKFAFGLKLTAYLGFGFAIPFIAAGYQLKKAGGGSD